MPLGVLLKHRAVSGVPSPAALAVCRTCDTFTCQGFIAIKQNGAPHATRDCFNFPSITGVCGRPPTFSVSFELLLSFSLKFTRVLPDATTNNAVFKDVKLCNEIYFRLIIVVVSLTFNVAFWIDPFSSSYSTVMYLSLFCNFSISSR